MDDALKVQGIGGVFLYADDFATLRDWYQERLGVEWSMGGDAWCGFEYPGADLVPGKRAASTTFSIFKAEAKLAGAPKTARVNFRVPDLDGLLATLSDLEIEREPDESYGRFAWVHDPEGNRVELWEPALS